MRNPVTLVWGSLGLAPINLLVILTMYTGVEEWVIYRRTGDFFLPQYEFNRKYNNDVYYFLRERVRNKSIIKNPGSSWDYTVLSFIVMNLISGCATTKGF